jgi:hypothetical protein
LEYWSRFMIDQTTRAQYGLRRFASIVLDCDALTVEQRDLCTDDMLIVRKPKLWRQIQERSWPYTVGGNDY